MSGIDRTGLSPSLTPPVTGMEGVKSPTGGTKGLGSTSEALPPVAAGPPGSSRPALPPPAMDGSMIGRMLMELGMKRAEEQTKASKTEVEHAQVRMQELNKERAEALQKSLEKIDKASGWETAGKVLGWLSVAAMAVIGVALIATGAGTAAGIGLMAAATIGAGVMIAEQTGLMDRITEPIANGISSVLMKFGMDEQTADMIGKISASVAVAVGVIALQAVASGGLSLKAGILKVANLVKSTALSVAKVGVMATAKAGAAAAGKAALVAIKSQLSNIKSGLSMGANLITDPAGSLTAAKATIAAADKARLTAATLKTANVATQAGIKTAQSGTAIGVAAEQHGAALDRAHVAEIKAEIAKQQSMLEQELEALDRVLKRSEEAMQTVMEMMSTAGETRSAIARSMV